MSDMQRTRKYRPLFKGDADKMIKVVARHKVKVDKIAQFIELAKELVANTQKLDEGCIHYDLYQDQSDPAILTIMEEWASPELLDRHMNAKHFLELVPRLGALCEGPADINLYRML